MGVMLCEFDIYALTLEPVCWMYAAETWSLETRAIGMGIAALGNWLFNFALGLFSSPAFRNILLELFVVFGVLCWEAATPFFFHVCGNMWKPIEEIEFLF
jgi:hypothetical protein